MAYVSSRRCDTCRYLQKGAYCAVRRCWFADRDGCWDHKYRREEDGRTMTDLNHSRPLTAAEEQAAREQPLVDLLRQAMQEPDLRDGQVAIILERVAALEAELERLHPAADLVDMIVPESSYRLEDE